MKETSKQEQIMTKGTFYAMKASFVKATTIILSQTLLASNIGNIRSATSLKHEALISPFVIKRKKEVREDKRRNDENSSTCT